MRFTSKSIIVLLALLSGACAGSKAPKPVAEPPPGSVSSTGTGSGTNTALGTGTGTGADTLNDGTDPFADLTPDNSALLPDQTTNTTSTVPTTTTTVVNGAGGGGLNAASLIGLATTLMTNPQAALSNPAALFAAIPGAGGQAGGAIAQSVMPLITKAFQSGARGGGEGGGGGERGGGDGEGGGEGFGGEE